MGSPITIATHMSDMKIWKQSQISLDNPYDIPPIGSRLISLAKRICNSFAVSFKNHRIQTQVTSEQHRLEKSSSLRRIDVVGITQESPVCRRYDCARFITKYRS
jgi:hypothetical protein